RSKRDWSSDVCSSDLFVIADVDNRAVPFNGYSCAPDLEERFDAETAGRGVARDIGSQSRRDMGREAEKFRELRFETNCVSGFYTESVGASRGITLFFKQTENRVLLEFRPCPSSCRQLRPGVRISSEVDAEGVIVRNEPV